MFSFHKPRVYRSGSGCCICRAKSSSSRFTDSKRYEEDFFDCFKLDEKRTGEICNACVLLVKRWKKLPRGSERNWQHVVDARAGHGSKPMSKINKVKKTPVKREKLSDRGINEFCGKKDLYIPKLIRTNIRQSSPSGFSDDIQYCLSNGSGSYDSSLNASPRRPEEMGGLEDEAGGQIRAIQENNSPVKHMRKGRSKKTPKKSTSSKCSFLDLDFWKREKTCCGIIFKGPCGEVLLDRRYLNPCFCRSSAASSPSSLSPTQSDHEPLPTSNESSCFDENSNTNKPPPSSAPADPNIETMRMLAATATSLKNAGGGSGNLQSMDSFMNGLARLPPTIPVD